MPWVGSTVASESSPLLTTSLEGIVTEGGFEKTSSSAAINKNLLAVLPKWWTVARLWLTGGGLHCFQAVRLSLFACMDHSDET